MYERIAVTSIQYFEVLLLYRVDSTAQPFRTSDHTLVFTVHDYIFSKIIVSVSIEQFKDQFRNLLNALQAY